MEARSASLRFTADEGLDVEPRHCPRAGDGTEVLLRDEPFGALTRAHLQDSVMALQQTLGNTVLMITYDVDEVALFPDRIVMMTNGPSARIGEVLEVSLLRPRKRLEMAANPVCLKCRQRVLEFLSERHRYVEAA